MRTNEPIARVQRLNQPKSHARQQQQVAQYMKAAQLLIIKGHQQQDRSAFQQAFERIQAAQNLAPEAPEPYMALAYLLFIADQPLAALQTLEQIRDTGPHFLAVADLKRMLSEQSGHQAKAQVLQSFSEQVLGSDGSGSDILTEALSPLSTLGGTGGLDFSALANVHKRRRI